MSTKPTTAGRMPSVTAVGNHFSCSLTVVLLNHVREYGGDAAVAEVLDRAGCERPVAELCDIANWISYDEAIALWRAGGEVTHHPNFARAVGEDSIRHLNGSPVAALLRSLGSPENVYRQIATTATKYSIATTLEAINAFPGRAEIIATAVDGFPRSAHHCQWTMGLLSNVTMLFGLPPAVIGHEECAAYGAPSCRYRISWEHSAATAAGNGSEHADKLHEQLDAMNERLNSMFQTAGDLIGAGELDAVLGRIADRAAMEIRAPRHLLALRVSEGGELHTHHKGFGSEKVAEYAERLLALHPAELPATWLAVPIRSNRNDYGRLLATCEEGSRFFPQERELFEVYARYAASALDSATALMEAKQRYAQSSALLELARALAAAGTSVEVARRLADSVPLVVDCDQVGVYVWDPTRSELVRHAITQVGGDAPALDPGRSSWKPERDGVVGRLLRDPNPTPLFMDDTTEGSTMRDNFSRLGFAATIVVPLAAPGQLLGLLTVSVRDLAERLRPNPDLLDRLSGVAAQGTTALQNGRLVDLITHQALHDQLTGLANRLQFTTELRSAVTQARASHCLATLFYLDLDGFKPVNDEFGHEAGDALLVAVAKRLAGCTRASDVVARLGGDEFAVLLTAPSAEDVEKVATRITAAFAEPFEVSDRRLDLGVSLGRSVYPLDADDAESMLRQADAKMFAHKRARRSLRVAPRARVAAA